MSLILDGTNGLSDIDGTAATPAIRGTDTNTGIFFPAADTIAFSEGGVEAARFDSAGNLGIGTASPTQKLQVYSSSGSGGQIQVTNASTGATATDGVLFGYDGSNDVIINNQEATATKFYTSSTERMRLDNTGCLLLGQTTKSVASLSADKIQAAGAIFSTGAVAGVGWENRSGGVTSTSNWYFIYTSIGVIYFYNGASNIASINSSTGAYTALSDANKKKDFEESFLGLNAVMQLKPTLYRMKDADENSPKDLGFIAQDVKDVIPQAYVETENEDAGGKQSTYIGLNDRPIIAVLTKAIQELKAELDNVKSELATLKGAA